MSDVYVVQFPHPGREHTPKGETMPWNQRKHRRKFLVSDGVAQDADGVPHRGRYTFWGEWEAPSRVVDRWPTAGSLPRYLHSPYWAAPPGGERQNTDPWVFGERFRYSNCNQLTPRPHCNPSALQHLTHGSIVLFGSQINGEFVLDTVLVVANATRYMPVDSARLGADDAFSTCTLDSLRTLTGGLGFLGFTLYTGATPDDPIDGMFSFTPCRPEGQDCRFARPPVRLPGLVNPASKQSPSGAHRPLGADRVRQAWDEVRHQVLAHDLLLGTHFDTPAKKGSMPLIPQGYECPDRSEFTELLLRWFEETDEPTIGDGGNFGGRTWVLIRVAGHRCELHADTTRAAIARYLDLARELGSNLPWQVTANTRGKINKIAVEPSGEPTPGLYLYTADELPAPATL